tara:strand:- start:417 stop:2135 length:1719 start_codon:yes stop_codon:yes gene_type:complete
MEKIKKLKQHFKKELIDGYLVPKNDQFFGEYVSKYNDRLNYISNFSGSYGLCLILKKNNYLFVDGRYTLQAKNQSGKLFKVITLPIKNGFKFLGNRKLVIGYDPKLYTNNTLKILFKKTNYEFKPIIKNLVDEVWKRKLKKNSKKFYKLPDKSVGENFKKKINRVVENLKRKKADLQFITASENNAWLLNIRGRDSKYSPIPFCYILIDCKKKIKFFCNIKQIPSSFKIFFRQIKFLNINKLDEILKNIYNKKFIIDKNTCSIYYDNIIKKNNKILKFSDPIYSFKAIKNKTEIDNIKEAHLYDGVALTKYLFWLKKNFYKKRISEISGSKKLLKFRKKSRKFKFLSFPTISSAGPNGAIIHYNPTNKTNRILKTGDIYLVDSGGQYQFGTTDVTRTISLKNTDGRAKNIFTRVLKGHIAVADFKLKSNTSGSIIDNKARKYLKEIGLNYSHGTGHGVGYFLNVHEGPHAISHKNKVKIQEGMIISNEPGYYEKNNFGIRIENLIYVKQNRGKKIFENLTLAPIDKELIDMSILSQKEKRWLNNYHKKVFNNLRGKMDNNEILDLKKACSAI